MSNSTSNSDTVTNPYCIKSNDNGSCSGLMLPILNEDAWPIGFRAFVYLLGLLWCFLGVSIIADTFMCSIERITSKTRKIRVADSSKPNGFHEIEVKVTYTNFLLYFVIVSKNLMQFITHMKNWS